MIKRIYAFSAALTLAFFCVSCGLKNGDAVTEEQKVTAETGETPQAATGNAAPETPETPETAEPTETAAKPATEAAAAQADETNAVMTALTQDAPFGGDALFEGFLGTGVLSFEDGVDGFYPRGGETVDTSGDYARSGAKSLHVYNRSAAWNGPRIQVTGTAAVGETINFAVYVLAPNGSDGVFAQLSAETRMGKSASYRYLSGETAGAFAAPGVWTMLYGAFLVDDDEYDDIFIYVETNAANTEFYIDDVYMTKTREAEPMDDLTALKDAYDGYFMIGTAISQKDFTGARANLLTSQFNAVTAENVMKPESLQPVEGVFNFEQADAFVSFARKNGLTVIGHTLCWHQQTPRYMFAPDLTREEAVLNLRHHIKNVVEHFKGQVYSWDVVNEAFDDGVPFDGDWRHSLRKSPWRDAIGDDYIEIAFQTAREFDPNAVLYYNDYNLDFVEKSKAAAAMIKDFKSRGVPIDGVGMQGHYNSSTVVGNVEDSIKRFIDAGVKISVTELDITSDKAKGLWTLSDELSAAQALKYAKLFMVYKNYAEHIERVTFWGMDDGSSWRADRFPLLFDKGLQPKQAFYAVINPEEFIAAALAPTAETRVTAYAKQGSPNVNADDKKAWINAAPFAVDKFVTAWETGATGDVYTLWDENALYVKVDVTTPSPNLDDSAVEPSRHDSVEIYFDEGETVRRYIINFKNAVTFSGQETEDGFASFADVTPNGFVVLAKIPFLSAQPKPDMRIGFDIKINYAQNGYLVNAAKWGDGESMGELALE